MTIDYEKLQNETSFNVLREDDGFLALSFTGGELNDAIVEFTDIDMLLAENGGGMSLEFDYKIETKEEMKIEETEELKAFLTNVLFSAISEQIGRED